MADLETNNNESKSLGTYQVSGSESEVLESKSNDVFLEQIRDIFGDEIASAFESNLLLIFIELITIVNVIFVLPYYNMNVLEP